MRIEKLREEFKKVKQKADLYQARAKDLEKKITEQENLDIINAVRSITASPEELQDVIGRINSMREPAEVNLFNKEKVKQHEDEK